MATYQVHKIGTGIHAPKKFKQCDDCGSSIDTYRIAIDDKFVCVNCIVQGYAKNKAKNKSVFNRMFHSKRVPTYVLNNNYVKHNKAPITKEREEVIMGADHENDHKDAYPKISIKNGSTGFGNEIKTGDTFVIAGDAKKYSAVIGNKDDTIEIDNGTDKRFPHEHFSS